MRLLLDTLLSSGSPRLYQVVADRLAAKDDPLRRHADAAYLYYTLARVSIENDEMMQDGPERALNKVFANLVGAPTEVSQKFPINAIPCRKKNVTPIGPMWS